MTDSAIRFPAEIIKVQTMADGGIRLTLDLPVGEIGTAAKLMEARQKGATLEIAAIALKQDENAGNGRKIHI